MSSMSMQVRAGLSVAALLGMGFVPATGAQEQPAESSVLAPPYEQGADSGGDSSLRQIDAEDGRVTAATVYPVPMPLFCQAPADTVTLRTAYQPAGQVTTDSVVAFEVEQALLDTYGFLTFRVTDAEGGWYGARQVRGPVAGGSQVTVPALTGALEDGQTPGVSGVVEVDLRGAEGLELEEQPELVLEFGVALSSQCPNASFATASFPEITVTY